MFMKQFLESAAEQCKILESHFSKRRSEIETLLAGNIIADEAAKPKRTTRNFAEAIAAMLGKDPDLKLMVEHYVEEAKKAEAASQPVVDADVPEWRKEFAILVRKRIREGGCWSAEFVEQVAREESTIIDSELSRRVAEATAEKDKRHLRQKQLVLKALGEVRTERDSLRQQLAAKDKRIAELEAIVADRSDMVKCVSDANSGLARHRDSLKQQLAAAQAEVARLSRLVDDRISDEERRAMLKRFDEWPGPRYDAIVYAVRPLLQAERNSRESAERRAATAEGYTRGFSQLAFTLCRRWHTNEGHAARNVNECREGWCGAFAKLNGETNVLDTESSSLLHDRAESAERERDELREAWAMFTVGETVNGGHKSYALAKPSDERNNVVLAAYRAEKGKVAK